MLAFNFSVEEKSHPFFLLEKLQEMLQDQYVLLAEALFHNLPGEVSQQEKLSKTKFSSNQLVNNMPSLIHSRYWEFRRGMLQICAIRSVTALWSPKTT